MVQFATFKTCKSRPWSCRSWGNFICHWWESELQKICKKIAKNLPLVRIRIAKKLQKFAKNSLCHWWESELQKIIAKNLQKFAIGENQNCKKWHCYHAFSYQSNLQMKICWTPTLLCFVIRWIRTVKMTLSPFLCLSNLQVSCVFVISVEPKFVSRKVPIGYGVDGLPLELWREFVWWWRKCMERFLLSKLQ